MHSTFIPSIYRADTSQEPLPSILCDIKNGKYEEEISEVRRLQISTDVADQERARNLKRQLPAFRPQISMANKTDFTDTDKLTGLIHFDFDLTDNSDVTIEQFKDDLSKHPSIYYAFLSPSGGAEVCHPHRFSTQTR